MQHTEKLSENTTNQNQKSNFLSHIAVVSPETQALDIASCSYLFQNPHLLKAVNPTEKKNHNDHNSENADTIKKMIQLLLNFLIKKTTPNQKNTEKAKRIQKESQTPRIPRRQRRCRSDEQSCPNPLALTQRTQPRRYRTRRSMSAREGDAVALAPWRSSRTPKSHRRRRFLLLQARSRLALIQGSSRSWPDLLKLKSSVRLRPPSFLGLGSVSCSWRFVCVFSVLTCVLMLHLSPTPY